MEIKDHKDIGSFTKAVLADLGVAETCKSCPFPKDKTKITRNTWKEGESKYKWNKVGTYKDSSFICEVCGNVQHFINL